MRFTVLTTFPGMFRGPLSESLMKKARARGLVDVRIVNLRRYARDRHRTTDDRPYGGGAGMVMKAEPILAALDRARKAGPVHAILTSPQGRPFTQADARRLSRLPHLFIICGHYRGVDARVEAEMDESLSIGDYVLTGGEIPAAVMIDAVARLVPGVVGDDASVQEDTFQQDLVDAPQYTRPAFLGGVEVPPVLLSGDHQAIVSWRRQASLSMTFERRPDLLTKARLTTEDRRFLRAVAGEATRGLDR